MSFLDPWEWYMYLLIWSHENSPFRYMYTISHGSVNGWIGQIFPYEFTSSNRIGPLVFWALSLQAHVSKRADWFNEEVHNVTCTWTFDDLCLFLCVFFHVKKDETGWDFKQVFKVCNTRNCRVVWAVQQKSDENITCSTRTFKRNLRSLGIGIKQKTVICCHARQTTQSYYII